MASPYWIAGLSRRHACLLVLPYAGLCTVLIIWPLLRLVAYSYTGPTGLASYGAFFANRAKLHSLFTTLRDASVVAVAVIAIGSCIAWRLRTTTSRWLRVALTIAIFGPLWMSAMTKIFAITVLMQRLGIVNKVLQWLGIVQHPVTLLYNEPIVVAGIIYQMLPYGVLPLLVTFSMIELDLIHAAETLGAARWRAVLSVVMPIAAGSMIVTGIMVYLISLGYFLTPVLLGGPASPFIASMISQDVFQYFDLSSAATSAVLLILVAGLLVGMIYGLLGKDRLGRGMAR